MDLSNNKISDIKVLENVDFKKLQKLDLCSNKINYDENSSILEFLKSNISDFKCEI